MSRAIRPDPAIEASSNEVYPPMLHDPDGVNDLDQIRSRYHLLRQLGHDGPFSIYAVRSRDFDKHYLLKMIHESGSQRTRAGALQPWQAHTVEALDHPKLLPIHAVHYLQGGTVGIATERCRGRTVAELLARDGALSFSRIEHILRDIAEALEYLHGRGVVHRGVRPHSIFLDYDRGHARLAIFGIDQEPDDPADGETGALIRQFSYLAPEQISGRERVDGRRLSPRSDLYSLGLTGLAMLTGRPPWRGASLEELLKARKREPLAAVEELRPEAPAHLRAAIASCLEPRPRRRCRTAIEFLALLDSPEGLSRVSTSPVPSALRRGEAGAMSGSPLVTATPDPAAARKGGMVAAAAAAIGLLAFGALRATDEPGMAAGPDLQVQTTTVLELPLEQTVTQPLPHADSDLADPSASAFPRIISRDSADAGTPPRRPAGERGSEAPLPPPTPLRHNLASADRIVLLGEPISQGTAAILGEGVSTGVAPRR